jgi:hypothetical protein
MLLRYGVARKDDPVMEKKQLQAVPGLSQGWMSKSLELAVEDPTMALRLIRLSVHASLALRGEAAPRKTKVPKPR